MPDPLDESEALRAIGAATLAHYSRFADAYREATGDHDVRQNIDALLGAIEGEPPYRILDLGCGPGRDLIAFRALGHQPIGLDGSPEFVQMARAASGAEVWQQDMLALDLPARRFDGVFANAVLFHVPSRALPRVLGDLRATLEPRGALFCSNPRGRNEEGFADERYACFYDLARWCRLVSRAGFELLDHYYRPTGKPRHRQPWLATVWRKGGAENRGAAS
ncbi:MAG: class I SAM-dependent DNA methyltransferase [Geminicoccales bacterium]